MHKSLVFAVAACLALAGCQVFKRSETWATVTKVRGTYNPSDPDPSRTYATRLHRVLQENAIEHKLVTYQFRYTTRLRETAVGTRSAVIYKDASTPSHPWWLMDERLAKPIWLPNEALEKQLAFYLRNPTELVEQSQFPGEGPGKNMAAVQVAPDGASPQRQTAEADFRATHGTKYDPASAVDRRKLEHLKQSLGR